MNIIRLISNDKRWKILNCLPILVSIMQLVSSCSPSAELSPDHDVNAVQFKSMSIYNNEAHTRSFTTITDGKIGVFRTNYNNYTVQNNVEYSYNGYLWTSAVPMSVGFPNAHLGVYYPYGAAGITYATNPEAITITSQKYTEAEDLCYDSLAYVSMADCILNPILRHAYAKITFIFKKKDATYVSNGAISNISITNSYILKSNTLNIIKGAYGSGTVGAASYNPGITSIALGDSAVSSMLIVPVTTPMSGNITFSFKIDGQEATTTIDAEDYGLTTLEAGQSYTIPVTLSGKQASISKVTLNSWSTGYTCSADISNPIVYQEESNCYIVKPSTTIGIPISRVTTGGETVLTSTWTCGVVWADAKTLQTSPSGVQKGGQEYISVTTGTAEGNAVVYIKDSNGAIIWSWHLWVTNYNPNTNNVSVDGYTWMDRNLGALANDSLSAEKSYGLFFQWGRKDPFQRKSYSNDDVMSANDSRLSFNNPDKLIVNTSAYFESGTWGDTNHKAKTVYDPCPIGWRVPNPDVLGMLSDSIINNRLTYSTAGYNVPKYGWFPCANSMQVTSYDIIIKAGFSYYSSEKILEGVPADGNVYCLEDNCSFSQHNLPIVHYNVPQYAMSVRCIKE